MTLAEVNSKPHATMVVNKTITACFTSYQSLSHVGTNPKHKQHMNKDTDTQQDNDSCL